MWLGCWVLRVLRVMLKVVSRKTDMDRESGRAIDKEFTVRVHRRIANRCRNTNNSTSQESSPI